MPQMPERTVWGDVKSMVQDHLMGVELTLNGTISMIRRRWTVLAGCIGLSVALAFVFLLIVPPQYTAQSLLQMNTRTEQVTDFAGIMSSLGNNDFAIRTEVDVLSSRKLAGRVIDAMKLEKNADFMSGEGFFSQLGSIIHYVLFPMQSMPDDKDNAMAAQLPQADTGVQDVKPLEDPRRSSAINILLGHLNVQMQPRSYSIVVQYTAKDPKLAAAINNALAQEYLNSQLEDKLDATRRATEWMNERLKQMQQSVQASELAVEKFREAHNLMEAKGVLLSEQQLSELNSQLIVARTQLAEAEAKAGQSGRTRGGVASSAEVLSNQLITNLREQEAQVRRDMSELASRYGAKHPRMQTARNQLADLERKIGEEIGKIRNSLDNNVAVAQARVNTLQSQLSALQEKTNMGSDASVQLAELERQAAAEKTLYESFLQRSKELSQMDFAQTDARVISPAEVPQGPSEPKKKLVMLAAVVLGAALGVGLMLALEAMDSAFRTTTQLEGLTGLPVLGLLGELPKESEPATYVLDKPTGAFTEAVRSIRTAMQFANPDKETKVVMTTSTVPQEGKSTFALSLAQLSAMGGSKVLLVDADLRRPTLAKQLGLTPKAGLAELLVGKATAKDVLMVLPKSKLTVVPAIATTHFAQELVSSHKMAELMAEWRKTYDLIVVDCPPVMAVSDALSFSTMADAMLFVVRWGSTPRVLVGNAIKQLKSCGVNITGTILSRVDLEKQGDYGYGDYGYYYGKYKEYYNN
jgi:capsular exopolysaccharide synthesis family protein